MPIYTFKDKTTGEVFEKLLKIADREKFLDENPNLERVIDGSAMISYSGEKTKPDAGFRDLLKHIKGKHIHSTINDF